MSRTGNCQSSRENLAEDTQELLTAPETDHYAFRAEYRFSGDGMLSGVQVDGTVLSPGGCI